MGERPQRQSAVLVPPHDRTDIEPPAAAALEVRDRPHLRYRFAPALHYGLSPRFVVVGSGGELGLGPQAVNLTLLLQRMTGGLPLVASSDRSRAWLLPPGATAGVKVETDPSSLISAKGQVAAQLRVVLPPGGCVGTLQLRTTNPVPR